MQRAAAATRAFESPPRDGGERRREHGGTAAKMQRAAAAARAFESPPRDGERARQVEARALRKLRRKPQTFHKNLKEFIKPSKP